ncbi:lipocalin-like domain-containing protein [Flavobacterium celericrescens]|uniref:Lipocalin family protein n=1 Tax=Flavobacterium celericrescens TaxID=2709780 RepID=A0ABX0I9S1_9FLAO|nr:lipocalin family protein [Flavobacterium celericrescens]NHM03924.1 lipocalin family protein [Flavobacterium celericrescens]
MKKIILFLVFGLFLSCKQSISETDLQNLNGYWEIEKVELPDGDKKEYKVNETIDFFKISDKKGFRSKVMPQIDGTYLTNDLKEDVVIVLKDGDATIQYKTNYANWNEEIIELSKDKLVVKNQQDLEYHYKRPAKFSIK